MIDLNYQVDELQMDPEEVARNFVLEKVWCRTRTAAESFSRGHHKTIQIRF